MAFLRYICAPLAIGALLLGAVLVLLPRFIDVDRHRQKVLERINRVFPGRVDVQHAELILIPRIGIRVTDLKVQIGEAQDADASFLEAPSAEMWLDLRHILDARRQVRARARTAHLHLRRVSPVEWNLHRLLRASGGTAPPTVQKRTNGEREDRPSFFEDLDIGEIRADALSLDIEIPPASERLGVSDVVLYLAQDFWAVRGDLKPSTGLLEQELERCIPAARPFKNGGTVSVSLRVKPEGIDVVSWAAPAPNVGWSGTLGWNGRVELHSGSRRISGILSQLYCTN